jgi:hypothetical protein
VDAIVGISDDVPEDEVSSCSLASAGGSVCEEIISQDQPAAEGENPMWSGRNGVGEPIRDYYAIRSRQTHAGFEVSVPEQEISLI